MITLKIYYNVKGRRREWWRGDEWWRSGGEGVEGRVSGGEGVVEGGWVEGRESGGGRGRGGGEREWWRGE